MQDPRELVQYIVGGYPYTLSVADIKKFPESFFARSIDENWRQSDAPIVIERDGDIFRYISAFITFGQLPRLDGKLALSSETIGAIKVQADFYNMPAPMKDCDRKGKAEDKLESFFTMRPYIESVKGCCYYDDGSCVYPRTESNLRELVNALATVWGPFCVKGKYCKPSRGQFPLLKSSTISSLNIHELLTECQESPFGRGAETVFDPTVRKSWEIPAAKLNADTLSKIMSTMYCSQLAPNSNVELRPYKLVIYQEGGHFDAHRDTVRGDGHIGTLVLILNSEYTGGELEITHNGQTEVVTGPYNWVAMYGDCLHKINPVTSGTRVSLIFDIYATPKEFESYEGFWSEEYYEPHHTDPKKVRGVSEGIQQVILDGLNQALEGSESVVICLGHKYPHNQTTPAFLKGGDLALYELLKNTYDVKVVACTVVQCLDEDRDQANVTVELFTLFDPRSDDSVVSEGSSGAGEGDEEGREDEDHRHNEKPEDSHREEDESDSALDNDDEEQDEDEECDYEDAEEHDDGEYGQEMDDCADYEEDEDGVVKAVHDAGKVKPESDDAKLESDEDNDDEEEDEDEDEESAEEDDGSATVVKRRAQLVIIPTSIDAATVLDYSPYIEHTGNESQAGSRVYLVAGLQLRRREKVDA